MARRSGCRRAGCGCAVAALALALLAALLLTWSTPLSGLARAGLASATGGGVTLDDFRLFPRLSLSGLAVRGPDAFEPVLALDRLTVDYRVRPADGRYVESVSVQGPRVVIDVQPGVAPNYQFLLPASEPASEARPFVWPSLAWIPRNFDMAGGAFHARAPRGEVRVAGLGLEARLDAWDAAHLRVDAAPLEVAWRLAGEPEWSNAAGPLRLDAETLEGTHHLALNADVTGLRTTASATARNTPEGGAMDLDIATLHLDTWTDAIAQLSPVPLAFTSVAMHDSRVSLHWSDAGMEVDGLNAAAELRGLRAGSRASTGWALGDAAAGQLPVDATLTANLRREAETHHVDAAIALTDLASASLAGWVRRGDSLQTLDVSLPELRVAGALLGTAPPGTVPPGFSLGQAVLSDARVAGALGADRVDLSALRGTLVVDDFVPGDTAIPEALAPLLPLAVPRLAVQLDATRFDVAPDRMAFEGQVAAGDAIRLEGRATLERDSTDWRVDAALREFVVRGPVLVDALAAYTPIPVDLRSMAVRNGTVKGLFAGLATRLEAARFDLTATGLRLGPADAPWYAGDPTLAVDGALEMLVATGRATLNTAPEQAVTLTGRVGPAGADLAFEADSGPRAAWTALLPPAYRIWLDYAPALARATATGTLRSDTAGARSHAVITPALDTGADTRITIDTVLPPARHADGTPMPWPTAIPDPLRVQSTVALGDASATIEADYAQSGRIDVRANVQNLDPAAAIRDWLGTDPLAGIAARGTGVVSLAGPLAGPLVVASETQWDGLALGEVAWPDAVKLAVDGTVSNSLDAVDRLRLAVDGGFEASLNLDEAAVTLSPPGMTGTLETNLGEALLTAIFDYFGYEAAITAVTGTVGLDANMEHVSLRPDVVIDTPWISAAGLPGYLPLSLDAEDITLDPERLAGEARGLRVSVDDRMAVAIDTMDAAWTDAGATARIPEARVRLGALPYAHWFFDESKVKGDVTLTGFTYAAGIPQGSVAVDLVAETLLLSGGLAKLTDVTLRGDFAFVPPTHPEGPLGSWALAGTGEIRVGGATSGGITATNLVGALHLGPEGLIIDIADGRFYDGLVRGLITVDLTRDTYRTRADVTFSEADLATFTREYQPPQVKLTGVAQGAIGVEIDRYGVLDISGGLVSDEGFTLNRDMVQRLLMYDQLGGFYGGKQLSRALDRVLGEDPQRPFDQATVGLRYEGAWLNLDTVLRSKAAHTLNIDVDTTLDPVNLYNFLSEQQSAAISGLDSLDQGL